MKPLIFRRTDLLLGKELPSKKWERIFWKLFSGKLNPVEMKTLLLLSAKNGKSVNELTSCLKIIRQLEPPKQVDLPFLMDVCGTGGDGLKTFNISTISALVIAGAGGYVAKHGNRAVSSQAGSSDLIEALGIRFDIPFTKMLAAVKKFHFGYFHAPLYHPCFSHVQAVRHELGIRTFFNALGPLVNPLEVAYQVIGVSHAGWFDLLGQTLRTLKRKKAAIVRSEGGMDELSTQEWNDILYLEGQKMVRLRFNPKKFGFIKARKEIFQGGDVRLNRQIALGILNGKIRDARLDVVVLNSGFALHLLGIVRSIADGIEKSKRSIRTGRALAVLEAVKEFTNRRN